MNEILAQNPDSSIDQTTRSINVFIGILSLVIMGLVFLRLYIIYLMSDTQADINADDEDEDYVW